VRRLLPAFILTLLPVLLIGCTRDWRVGDDDPPNIVLIVVDTLRADHLGCYGYERPTSPHIDTLCGMSTVFDRAYSHSPWTMPSVASMLTGLEPREHGITSWGDPLEQQLVTIAEVLSDNGYHTGAAVSHYILKPDYHFDQGFEVYNTTALELGSVHDSVTSDHIYRYGKKLTMPDRGEPWFVMLHFFDPHAWYQPHPEFDFGTEEMDLYDGEIAYTDLHIGKLLDTLHRREQMRDTIVVIIADHGEAFMDHGHKQHTISLYEELIRVPFIIWVPGFEARRMDTVVAETQLAPTLLSLAGLPIPPSMRAPPIPFDATGFLEGEDRTIYAETKRRTNKQAMIEGDWKYMEDRLRRTSKLYDLASDPGETENLKAKDRERTKDLRGKLRDYRAQGRIQVETVELSSETQAALEALGYMGGADAPEPAFPDPRHEPVPDVVDPELSPE